MKRVGSTLHYLHRDHLSSVRAISDSTGAAYRLNAYKPFGEQVTTVLNPLTPVESKGWIGERTDPKSGLTYLHARYYDAVLGRFLTPDWWDVSDPAVGPNRYAYAANDPNQSRDPSGHAYGISGSDAPKRSIDCTVAQKVHPNPFPRRNT